MATQTCCEIAPPVVPCQAGQPDLWFSDDPVDLERAKALCTGCPTRRDCLVAALERQEPWGVWGGEIIERGAIVASKPQRGRPRKNAEESPPRQRARGFGAGAATCAVTLAVCPPVGQRRPR